MKENNIARWRQLSHKHLTKPYWRIKLTKLSSAYNSAKALLINPVNLEMSNLHSYKFDTCQLWYILISRASRLRSGGYPQKKRYAELAKCASHFDSQHFCYTNKYLKWKAHVAPPSKETFFFLFLKDTIWIAGSLWLSNTLSHSVKSPFVLSEEHGG